MVGREQVFAGAGAEDGAAYPYWRGGGFILRVSVVTHSWEDVVSLARLMRQGNSAGEDGEGGKQQGREAALTSACGTGVRIQKRGSTKWYLEENQTTVRP